MAKKNLFDIDGCASMYVHIVPTVLYVLYCTVYCTVCLLFLEFIS